MIKNKPSTNSSRPSASSEIRLRDKVLALQKSLPDISSAEFASWQNGRKIATVMFVDIVGSSKFVVGRDPEDSNDQLLIILGLIIESIERYEGTIIQIMGDGILAAFGAPNALEDHATRACLAALHMQKELQPALKRFPRFAHQPPVAIRIGIDSGEVLTQPAPGQSLTDYRVVGDSVYVSQRLQSRAQPNTTHLGPETMRILGSSVVAEEQALLQMTPESPILRTFLLRDIASVKRPSIYNNSFVGRTAELNRLATLLEQCESGQGQGICIAGEAGIGKSRLVYEFKMTLPLSWLVIEYLLDNLPSHPMRFLQEIWRIFTPSPPSKDHDMAKVIRQLLVDFDIKEVFGPPALLELMGLPADNLAWDSLGAEEKLAITSATLAQIVVASSRKKPILLIIEDYQWPSTDIISFLTDLVPRLPDSRVLLLITNRIIGEFNAPFDLPVISLDSLTVVESRQIMDWFFGSYPDLEEMKDFLLEKTQGNPLFLLECQQMMAQKGYVTGSLGNYRMGASYTSFTVPPSVHTILAERVDHLKPYEREVLSTASVMGVEFFYLLLAYLLSQPLSELQPLLTHLEQSGFIVPEPLIPGKSPSSRFRHNLMQDVSYNTLLKKNRRYLHQQSIVGLEGKLGKKISQRWQQLARHSLLAEDWRKAYIHNRRAAYNAFTGASNREAIDFYRGSLIALRQLELIDPSPAQAVKIIDVNLSLVKPYFVIGNWTQVDKVLEEALNDSQQLNNPLKELETRTFYILLEWIKGNHKKAIQIAEKLLQDETRVLTQELKIRILARLGGIYFDMGNLPKSLELFEYILNFLESGSYKYKKFGLLVSCSVMSLTQLGQIYAEKGNFKLAVQYGDQALKIALSSPDVFSQIYVLSRVGTIFLRKKDFSRALPLLEESTALCEQTKSKLLYHPSIDTLIYTYAKLGNKEKASYYLRESLSHYYSQSSHHYSARYFAWLGDALFAMGDIIAAQELAYFIIRKSEEFDEQINLAWARCLLTKIQIDQANFEGVQNLLEKISEVAQKYQLLPLIAEYYKLTSQLAYLKSNKIKFNDYRQKANQLFEEMGIKDEI